MQELKQKTIKIIEILKTEFPNSRCSLNYENPFQLLIATILAAQCTDARVNQVTKEILFPKYKTPEDFLKVPVEKLESDIHSTGFYKNKAKSIRKCCQTLVEKFNSEVPKTMKELLTLGGVGRKTANVVLGECFGMPEGIVVDTHVTRISQKLGLTKEQNADKIELDLNKITPKNDWVAFAQLIVDHGRKTCNAKKPKCNSCNLVPYCLFVEN
ncbi:endonuclease III [bacterium]|nr:endonuclease III [bacterium]